MIEITINGKKYTTEEAKELYEELSKIFAEPRRQEYIPFPLPYPEPVFPPHYPTYPIITYTDNTVDDLTIGTYEDIYGNVKEFVVR